MPSYNDMHSDGERLDYAFRRSGGGNPDIMEDYMEMNHDLSGIKHTKTDFKNAQALGDAERIANETWRAKFNKQPYSSIEMTNWLVNESQSTTDRVNESQSTTDPVKESQSKTDQLWQNPLLLKNVSVKDEELDDDTLNGLVSSCGRCTTFTLQVAHALEDQQIMRQTTGFPKFRWEYHDVSGHRLARCKNSGLVIHSRSPKGFLTVPPGETLDVEGEFPRAERLSYTEDGISKLQQLQEAERAVLVTLGSLKFLLLYLTDLKTEEIPWLDH